MFFKFLNYYCIVFVILFLFSFKQKETKILLNDYYIIKKDNDIQKLIYYKDYKTYKDILYTKVVFD